MRKNYQPTVSAPKQLCQVEKGLSERTLPISTLPDHITLLPYHHQSSVSLPSKIYVLETCGCSDNHLHLYHQYLPGGNSGICLQHYIVTRHSFSTKGQFSCMKPFDTQAELSFPPRSPDTQERACMKPATHRDLRECISETRRSL